MVQKFMRHKKFVLKIIKQFFKWIIRHVLTFVCQDVLCYFLRICVCIEANYSNTQFASCITFYFRSITNPVPDLEARIQTTSPRHIWLSKFFLVIS